MYVEICCVFFINYFRAELYMCISMFLKLSEIDSRHYDNMDFIDSDINGSWKKNNKKWQKILRLNSWKGGISMGFGISRGYRKPLTLTRARIPRSHSCGISFENRRPYFAPSPRHVLEKAERIARLAKGLTAITTPVIVTWRECNAITFEIECEFEIPEPHNSRPDLPRLFRSNNAACNK